MPIAQLGFLLVGIAIGACVGALALAALSGRRRRHHAAGERAVVEIGLDGVSEALGVFDAERRLVLWNHRMEAIFEFPQNFLKVGLPADAILTRLAERGEFGPGEPAARAAEARDMLRRIPEGRPLEGR